MFGQPKQPNSSVLTQSPNEVLRTPSEIEIDRISNLPENVTDQVLSLLSIKEAVKTSLLSRKWRHRWATVPCLVFDGHSFPICADRDGVSMTNKLVSDIDRVLLLHSGPLHTFKLSYKHCIPVNHIEKWILHLSRYSIKVFVLNVSQLSIYKMPTCMFSWKELAHLHLRNCSLRPPSTFKGFKNLKHLVLENMTLDQDVFENLISSCPLLETLTLSDLNGINRLNIHAPNLCILSIVVVVNNENYQNGYIGNFGCLIKVMSDFPQLRSLRISGYSLLYLAKGDIPRELPSPCVDLISLSISIDFTNFRETSAFLCLLRSVPNLQQLFISSYCEDIRETSNEIWEAEQWSSPFSCLGHVKINYFGGIRAEIDFIKFILLASPVLKQITVKLDENADQNWEHKGDKGKLEIVTQLLRFKRASPHAQIIFEDQA